MGLVRLKNFTFFEFFRGQVVLSRIKSLIHSIFFATSKKYKKEEFNADYFSKFKLSPDNKKASYYRDFFSPDNALDVGCGVGNLVWGFTNSGIVAEGIDISEDAINRASASIRPHLRVGDIFNLDYSDKEFVTPLHRFLSRQAALPGRATLHLSQLDQDDVYGPALRPAG